MPLRRAAARSVVLAATLAAGIVVTPAVATDATVLAVTARFSATRVRVNEPVTVTGSANGDLTGATVTLERAMPGGRWRREPARVSVSGSRFSVRVPTWWLGRASYRVRVVRPHDAPPVMDPPTTIRVVPRYVPQGPREYRLWTWAGHVSRWDPCRTIGYRVNLEQAPANVLADVKRAVARISEATGLRFAYLGTTTTVPDEGAPSGDADVLVAWRTPEQYDFGNAAAVAPGHSYGGYETTAGTPVNRITDGAVVVNTDYNGALAPGFGPGARGELLMHELAHVVGLEHVRDSSQVMYPTILPASPARFGAGDLAGLEAVGAGQGCLERRR